MSKKAWEYGREIVENERPFPERAGRVLARTKNDIALYRHTCRLFKTLFDSPKKEDHAHWKYTEYNSFEQYVASVQFPAYGSYVLDRDELYDKIYAGWIAQVCAGAIGTAIEGYHTKALEKFAVR
ncbi:MAG: hypothetical protein HFI44_14750 [Lachnospiraceae bacterium]|jgi:hypothetical protein|nr:hypothetical protein [Lachnospiraceae bacterium]